MSDLGKKRHQGQPPGTLAPMTFDQAVDALLLAKPNKGVGKKSAGS
jgi:hypothetical protein